MVVIYVPTVMHSTPFQIYYDTLHPIFFEGVSYIIDDVLPKGNLWPDLLHSRSLPSSLREELSLYSVSAAHVHFFFRKDVDRPIDLRQATPAAFHVRAQPYPPICAFTDV
jgi:hypothetical protein